ncbi:hypothetical protein GOP47_0020770 [Adiantum capillus-veneris]|uniref:Protein kinase and PP2C-like domain-containing protein n=1 Tax=Adiantum capillus-veneris TaxID=13818 RepID=A0A9D4UA09_ADICA|nr:hypothetical protein GOP47_0020770 [Adiantum capillus-veneris]
MSSSSTTCFRGCCSSDRIPLAIVPKSSLTLLSPIASGAESTVYQARFHGECLVAKKPRLQTSDDIDRYHTELQLLSKIDHPNIIKLVAAHAQPPDYFFLFPMYEQGNLSQALHIKEWSPPWEVIAKICLQLANALGYLHKLGILHRDVKPANIFLDSEMNAYLGDFGLAMLEKDLQGTNLQSWKSTGKPTGGFYKKNMVGTLLYMAPEVLRKQVQTEKSDVYGFAVTINELATGVLPYTDRRTEAQAHTVLEMNYTEQQLTVAITSGLRPVLADAQWGIPSSLSSLIERCWNDDPKLRPSFHDILEELHRICTDLNMGRIRDVKKVTHDSNTVSANLGVQLQNDDSHWPRKAGPNTKDSVLSWGPSWCKRSVDKTACTPTISSGFFAARGGRDTMEDSCFLLPQVGGATNISLFGVLDGHRGPEAAEYATHAIPNHLIARADMGCSPLEALSAAFTDTDSAFRHELDLQRQRSKGQVKNWHPGCTAAVVLLVNNLLLVANAGDCRTILCRDGQATALSKDHTASCCTERDRVTSLGGQVTWQVDTWRVGTAALQVTRSIGDDDLKPAVTAEPEVTELILTENDEFLIIASDGLWDKISNEEAVSFVKDTVKEPTMSSKRLATEAVERGSTDNITVIIVFLKHVSTLERVF